jgi:periplasmic protein TonB
MVRFPLRELSADSAGSPRILREPDAPELRSRDDEGELFMVVAPRPSLYRGRWFAATGLVHIAALAALVLVPILWPEPLLDSRIDPIRVLIYDPPPPPPPPLPRGSPEGGRPLAPKPALAPHPVPTPVPAVPHETALVAPLEKPPVDEGAGLTVEAAGSPHGSESGVPEGMEEGVEGGMVGGVPGGVLGGVIGGTGTGPVPVPLHDVDRPPRLLRQVRPEYPSEAFVKKVEGTVVLEILIDERGRVARTRVVQSVRLLDAAAVAAVQQWVFAPAEKRGRQVATLALAPVSFRIF